MADPTPQPQTPRPQGQGQPPAPPAYRPDVPAAPGGQPPAPGHGQQGQAAAWAQAQPGQAPAPDQGAAQPAAQPQGQQSPAPGQPAAQAQAQPGRTPANGQGAAQPAASPQAPGPAAAHAQPQPGQAPMPGQGPAQPAAATPGAQPAAQLNGRTAQAAAHAHGHPGQAAAQAHPHPGQGVPGGQAPGQPYGPGPAAYGQPGGQHPQTPTAYQQPPNGGLHFSRMLQSEWTKIRTVRSTAWSLVVMVVLIVGMAALLGATVNGTDDERDPSVSLSLIGVMIAQIAAASLGVLTISAEYTTGMIRSTLTAYPRRVTVLAAKAVVFAVLMFVVGLVACYLAYLIGDATLTRDMVVDSENKDVVRGVLGSATYLSLLGLFSLGIGTILRHSAGAITTVLGIMLVPTIFGGFIPGKAGEWVVNYSPMSLLINMVAPRGELDTPLEPWPGMILMAGYAAAALIGAAALLKARDV